MKKNEDINKGKNVDNKNYEETVNKLKESLENITKKKDKSQLLSCYFLINLQIKVLIDLLFGLGIKKNNYYKKHLCNVMMRSVILVLD